MWFENSVIYHIYPLGFCGAPLTNDGAAANRLDRLGDWTPYIKELGADCLYLGPVFESDAHGYDTRDYRKIDCRLGDNKEFAEYCGNLREHGIKILLDGVFNHVGRGFWAFQDVLKNREGSAYRDWFRIDFHGNNGYNDGLWYEGWEGHFELVKLNLQNPEVVGHIFDCIKSWVDEFDIDGLRLDVAYSLDRDFVRQLRTFCKGLKPDFFLLGECLHGDYNNFVSPELMDSCTNYECYKGLFSSFNEMNLFEIGHSLNRQFGPDNWTLYKGKHLVSFVDNHDVSRIASILKNPKHLPLVYGLMFAMPGIPCIYYGSEWGAPGKKADGDNSLRSAFDAPVANEVSEFIKKLCKVYKECPALAMGDYKQLMLTNHQYAFKRSFEGKYAIVAINASDSAFAANLGISFSGRELLTGEKAKISDQAVLPTHSFQIWETE